jgi:pimeloyl-ACP methyl ester carboxylesterase
MPHITTDDGVKLFYQEVGAGIPIVFVHEFAGDCRSWEAQFRHFGRHYRCIAYNVRGFPPSDVPESVDRYSQARARDDIRAVLDGLKIDKAHVVGLSMGGFATLHFGFAYQDRARSLTIGGCGYGAAPDQRKKFAEEAEAAVSRRSGSPKPPRPMRSARRGCSIRTRTRAAGANSPTSSPTTPPRARP